MNTPAFPSTNSMATASGVMTQGHPGMTLRDYFAAKAMQAWLVGVNRPKVEHCAKQAYEIADAMLAAREGGAA
jgi:hypothetical protein